MVNRFLFADLEQNLFLCAIRQSDFVDPAYYYVFCDTVQYEKLCDLAKRKYHLLGTEVTTLSETDYFWLKRIELTPGKKSKRIIQTFRILCKVWRFQEEMGISVNHNFAKSPQIPLY